MNEFTFPKLSQPGTSSTSSGGERPTPGLPAVNPLMAGATVAHTSNERRGDADGSGSMPPPPPRLIPIQVAEPVQPQPAPRPRKVPLEKGYSQVAWLRLTQTAKDLAGLKGKAPRRSIRMSEVQQHNTADDCWVVLRGKVYNLGPYFRYHPGGAKILEDAAGTDCTALFNKYHAWVNGDALLVKCLVGLLEQKPAE